MRHERAVETRAAERYLLDDMSELERHLFEAHYFDCPECAEEVRMGLALREAAAAGPLAPAAPTAPKSSSSPLRLVSYAAAAALLLAVGYQSLVVIPELRAITAPQALAPIVLRPVSRGAETTVALRGAAPFVSLSLDVNLDPLPAELQYDLATASGATVASGRVAAPSPGTPLLLLIPGASLADGGYTLTVRAADGAGAALAYPFVVSHQ